MVLDVYRSKRDFSHTPEPRGGQRPGGRGDSFVIQKHAARRLHYDFRLELDGVLKSWAVPKGPSVDPDEKRLAVEVEDHPLEYGGFEGTIPKGEYGGGTVLLWDQGRWTPVGDPRAGYKKGKLKFELRGEKLRGGFTLVRMHGRAAGDDDHANWLLIKERDEHARPLSEGDILEERPESVSSARSLDEIASDRTTPVWRSNRGASGQSGREAARRPAAREAPRRRARRTTPVDPAALEGARKAPFPQKVEAQLATLVDEPPRGDGWIYEAKLDGYRVLARLDKGVELWTRRGQNWTHRFPRVRDALAALPVKNALLDGEVVVMRPDGVTDFQDLQNALGEGREASLLYFAFDLLYLDGYDLHGCTQAARKAALEALLGGAPEGGVLRYSEHLEEDGAKVYGHACELGLEGVIAKRADARYRPGRAGQWLKVKCGRGQEFVIGGFTDPSGARTGIGALLVGHYRGGKLVYAGKVGTGFTGEMLKELRRRLGPLERREPPFDDAPRMRGVHWVSPELVAEIRFAAWTRGARLRHATFQGLREDRAPETVVKEMPKSPPTSDVKPTGRKRETAAKPKKEKSAARKKETAAEPKPNKVAERKPKVPAASSKSTRTEAAPGRSRGGGKSAQAEIAGVRLTHPDKVLYPEQGLTKADLARYYEEVAGTMLPYVERRLLTLVRCPSGQGKPCFHQKHDAEGLPDDVKRVAIDEREGKDIYLYIEDVRGLVSLVQRGALEVHAWGSRVDTLEKPDMMIFDLDPAPDVAWARVVDAAKTVRHLLEALGLRSFVKTTGGKGLHVAVPIQPRREWDEVKAFTKAVAETLVRFDPKRYIATMSKAKRHGKVFVDYLRNGRGATAVAPYSTRARPGAPVATPIGWEELDGPLDPASFTIATVPERIAANQDPWAEMASLRQSLTSAMMKQVGL